jgi:AcrR family transcriptional regulator
MAMKISDQEMYMAIIKLIEQQGLKFTMADLARKLHTSKRTIYQRFSSKEQLISAMIDYLFKDLTIRGDKLRSELHLSAYEKIKRYVDQFPTLYPIGCILQYSSEIAQRYPQQWHKFQDEVDQISQTFYRILINDPQTRELSKTEKKMLLLMLQKTTRSLLNGRFLMQQQLDFWEAIDAMQELLFHGVFGGNQPKISQGL